MCIVYQVSRCARMLETPPLLNGTYLIIASPWPGLWHIHTQYGIPHINASTTYKYVGVGRFTNGTTMRTDLFQY